MAAILARCECGAPWPGDPTREMTLADIVPLDTIWDWWYASAVEDNWFWYEL